MRRGLLGVVWALALAGRASAQPAASDPAPVDPAPVEPGAGGYPVDVSQRPLLLPMGVVEVGAEVQSAFYGGDTDFGLENFDFVYGRLAMRGGLGPVELRGDADYLLAAPDGYTQTRVTRVGLGGAALIAPEVAITARASAMTPTDTDLDSTSIEAGPAVRRRISAAVALQGGVLGRYDRFDFGTASGYVFWIDAVGLGQVQVQPTFALEGRFRLSVPVADDVSDDFWMTTAGFGLRGLLTLPHVDVYAGLETASIFDTLAARTVSAGVAGRMP